MGTAFEQLQRDKLEAAWRADLPGSTTPHVMIGLPSYSVDRSLLDHYGDRVPALENRYLYSVLSARQPGKRVVYLSSLPVRQDVLDGYLALAEPADRPTILQRTLLLSPDDTTSRSLAEKVLDRGELVDALRRFVADELTLIEAWNVTEAEADLAVAIGAPIYGTDPRHREVATKSNGRRLLRDADVPVPYGIEDVRSPADVAAAVAAISAHCPDLREVVVKLDDSGAGDGNIVVDVDNRAPMETLLPPWYRETLISGGVVEERIDGVEFRSPSAQATITPLGEVTVLATHEQRLDGQVYEGCSFPADPVYAPLLGRYAVQVGERLADLGAVGRFALDFVARRLPSGDWDLFGIEINLRKGGTTHPYGVTRLLVGGHYDPAAATYVDRDGRPKFYAATDNLVDESWVGRTPGEVLRITVDSGLCYDRDSGTGVVPHLLDCLKVDGRMGYTALGDSPAQVAELEERFIAAVS
ncbi:MAG TPA: peptide ligase PGM1-related protein [Acidimicrobiales bacterium]|nr:peptide ligase PGM1-related protein [Acidimicrobiales bacterium]